MRPVSFDKSPVNASAWAAEMPNGDTRMVLLNKDAHQKLEISIPSDYDAKLWRLQASGLTATSGVTLAGAEIMPDKAWQPLHEEHLISKDNHVQIDLESASGAALFFNGNL